MTSHGALRRGDPTIGTNDATTVTPPTPGSAGMYTVLPDGTVDLPAETGFVTEDGALLLSLTNDDLASPGIRAFLRLQGAYTNASFSGSFHGALFTVAQAQFTTTATGFFVADGAGISISCPWQAAPLIPNFDSTDIIASGSMIVEAFSNAKALTPVIGRVVVVPVGAGDF